MLPVNVFHPDESEADFPGRRTVMEGMGYDYTSTPTPQPDDDDDDVQPPAQELSLIHI